MALHDVKNLNTYDNVLPTGFICAAAGQLQAYYLRLSGGPIDWCEGAARESFEQLLVWIKERFATFPPFEEFAVASTTMIDWLGKILVKHPPSQIFFPHDFTALTPEVYDGVAKKYLKIWKRTVDTLDNACGQRILLVYATRDASLQVEDFTRLLEAYRQSWNEVNFDLYVVQYCAAHITQTEHATPYGRIILQTLQRNFESRKDLIKQQPVWSFLSQVTCPIMPRDVVAARMRAQHDAVDMRLDESIVFWRHYFTSPEISRKEKRLMLKNLTMAYKRGFLRFRQAKWYARLCMPLFLLTRHPIWLRGLSPRAMRKKEPVA